MSATNEADVLVVGAGHNALISAAYLAVAGLRVLVLEGQSQPGGDTMTEELTLPGFRDDSCSTAHTLIQSNPLMRGNELHLDRFGLRYLRPDPVFVITFPDRRSLTMYRDLERTVAEIARYSRGDAAAYRELLADWEKLKPLQAAERSGPPPTPEESARLWRSGPAGDEGLRIRMASGLGIIQERFRTPEVQVFIAWVATMTLDAIDQPYTGILPFSLTAGRQEQSWAIPVGGSGALPDALVALIRGSGGEVVTDTWVRGVLLEHGRAAGVIADDGREFRAGRGVLSSAHIKQLPAMLPGVLDGESAGYVERWHAGLTMFVGHYACRKPPVYRAADGEAAAVTMGTLDSIDNLHRLLADFRGGLVHLDQPFLLCLAPTVIDPSRAPAGHHTLKIVGIQPYSLADGPEQWDDIKDEVADSLLDSFLARTTNLRRDDILGRAIHSPLDLERRNPNNYRGSCHGGSPEPTQSGWYRPMPVWNSYRTPVPGFYLTGSCTHPGGSVSGYPGRNAAHCLLEDLGFDWQGVLARAGDLAVEAAGR